MPVEDDPEKGKVKHEMFIEPENDLQNKSEESEVKDDRANNETKHEGTCNCVLLECIIMLEKEKHALFIGA